MDFIGDEDATRYALERAFEEQRTETRAACVPDDALPSANIARAFAAELGARGWEIRKSTDPDLDLVPLESMPNADAGDFTTLCTGCGEEMDEAHSWRDCNEVLQRRAERFEDAWWIVLGILHEVAPQADSPAAAAKVAVAKISALMAQVRAVDSTAKPTNEEE